MTKLTSLYRELAANFSALVGLKQLNDINSSLVDTNEVMRNITNLPESAQPFCDALDLTISLLGFDLSLGKIDDAKIERMTLDHATVVIGPHIIETARRSVYGEASVEQLEWRRNVALQRALANGLSLFMNEALSTAVCKDVNRAAENLDERTGVRHGYKSSPDAILSAPCAEEQVIAIEELGGLRKERIGPALVTLERLSRRLPGHSHKHYRALAKHVVEIYAAS